MTREWFALMSVVCGSTLCACGSGAGGEKPGADNDIGEARLAVMSVPTGVQCIRVSVSGGATTDFGVTAGSSSVLSIGRLPLGSVNLTANAYSVACASIGANSPVWVSDPLTVVVRAGVISNVTLNLRQNNTVSANINFVGNVVQMIGGDSATLYVMSDGTLRFSGYLVGDGGSVALTPAQFFGISNVVEAANGAAHACARLGDGTVWCWGDNTYGQVGNGTIGGYIGTPTQVTGVAGATRIAARGFHTCAITDTGAYVKCWGQNTFGQLGIGSTTNTASATMINPPLYFLERLYVGYDHTCASDGSATYCWGQNTYGQVGDNTTTQRNSPTQVSGNNPYVAMSLGNLFSCGVRADGGVRCWGANYGGQLGDGTTTNRLVPTAVVGITDATHIAAGYDFACVRRQGGTVGCWGSNYSGAIGDGTADNKTSPVTVAGVTGVASVAADAGSALAILDNQSIYSWGQNQNGQLGDGTRIDRFKPILVPFQ